MATVEVSTHQYERSHRKAPRGVGYWGFQMPTTLSGGPAHIHWFNGAYRDAKKSACARARVIGAYVVEVLP